MVAYEATILYFNNYDYLYKPNRYWTILLNLKNCPVEIKRLACHPDTHMLSQLPVGRQYRLCWPAYPHSGIASLLSPIISFAFKEYL